MKNRQVVAEEVSLDRMDRWVVAEDSQVEVRLAAVDSQVEVRPVAVDSRVEARLVAVDSQEDVRPVVALVNRPAG